MSREGAILVTGAAGLVGDAVARRLASRGHAVVGLHRRTPLTARALAAGVRPLCGDVASPDWLSRIDGLGAVVHCAAAFDGDMAACDARFVDAFASLARTRSAPLRVVSTGGAWLYPARVDPPIREGDPFSPLPAFAWMTAHRDRLAACPGIHVSMVHPAIVWGDGRGFEREIETALRNGVAVEAVGGADVIWPLVHRDDLALLYALAVEAQAGATAGAADWHGVGDEGIPFRTIVDTIAARIGAEPRIETLPVETAIAREGAWIAGRARSQRMSADTTRRRLGWQPTRRFLEAGAALHDALT